MQFLWKYIDDLVGKGLQFSVISELMLYTSASLVPLALPLAILLSSIMTFGNLAENNELTAIKSSGISLLRIMKPLIVVNLIVVISAFFFSNNVLPFANLKMRSLLYDIQQKRPELQIREGIFYDGIDGYSIKIGSKDFKTNMLYNILIYDHTQQKGNIRVSVADSGYMVVTEDKNYLIATLFSGHNYEEIDPERTRQATRTFPHRRESFLEQQIIIKLSGFGLNRTDESLFRSHFSMMNQQQLMHSIDSSKIVINAFVNQNATSLVNTVLMNMDAPAFPPDSINLVRPHNLNLDAFYNNLTNSEKKNLIDMALNFSKTGKNLITSFAGNHEWQIKRLRRFEIAWHEKITLSVACFIFFFIGAPLGAIIRRGGFGMPVVVSVLFFIFYYVISITAQKMVREDVIHTIIGMWFASALLMPMGIYLTYKAATDSIIFNLETYSATVKKLLKLLYFNGKKT